MPSTTTADTVTRRCPSPRPNAGDQVARRLSREWQRLRLDPSALRRAEQWRIVEVPLRDLDDVLAAVGFGVARSVEADRRLTDLVAVAAADDLAGRVVIQRLMPGLIAEATRRRSRSGRSEVLDELVGAAWISVRTYNQARRPGCIAAALLADARHKAFRSVERRRWTDERPTDVLDVVPAAEREPDPAEELAELFDIARASGVEEPDLDLLQRLLRPHGVDATAAELDVTPRTIRNRRARVARRLRQVALAA